jgi:hypothetical protein
MPIECEIRDGSLIWIKNPVTGVISYVVDVRGKSFAFTLGGREGATAPDARRSSAMDRRENRQGCALGGAGVQQFVPADSCGADRESQ